MSSFSTTRDAKEYLIGQIVSEAGREGVNLSEIERKMLYWSEDDLTVPDALKVNQEFEREYDNDEYEQKIAGLIRGIEGRTDRTPGEADAWQDAVSKLSEGDHYLSVLIGLAGRRSDGSALRSSWLPSLLGSSGSVRPKGDIFRLVVMAIAVCAILFAFEWLRGMLFR
jgi:hypothetical protein